MEPTPSKQSTGRSDSESIEIDERLTELPPAPHVKSTTTEGNATAGNSQTSVETLATHGDAPVRPDVSTMASARDIQLLIERGRQLFASGDVIAARLLFRRGANSGSAAAAAALGTTYDPAVLRNRGLSGSAGDSEKARSWYEMAHKLGLPEKLQSSELHAAPARVEEFGRRNSSPSSTAPTRRLIHSSSGAKH
jgi:TPR repeat protein